MIGKVTGRLDYVASDHALIEAAGVGYMIYCSDRTLAVLPSPGERVALYTEMVVREDAMTLFGFLTLAEKEWHRLLTSVQGVGAKTALAVLGTLGPEGIGRAISLGDLSAVKAAPGIGPKSAQRIVLELKDKAPTVMALGARGATPATVSGTPETPPAQAQEAPPQNAAAVATPGTDMAAARADALSALVNLGYGHGDAATAVAEAEAAADSPPDGATLIRLALRLLAPKG